MNKADSLNCIRHIAECFIAKHAPDEIRYFSIIWNRFCSENLFSQRSSQGSILTFSEHNNIGLVSPSVLFVLKGVMFELKTKIDKPSLEKVRNAVRACAVELGAPKDIAISLEQDISVMVYENLLNLLDSVDNICNPKFPQRRSVCVNSIRDIRIDGQKTEFEARQPLILFCELIRKNRLHWGSAFLLFPKWCNETVNNPKEQFKKLAYKMNMFMKDNDLEIKIDCEEKTGHVQLEVPKNIEIYGDIIESQNLIKEAEDMIKEGRNKDALDNSVKAFNKDAGCLRPLIVFAEAVAHLGSEQSCDFRESLIKIRGKLKYNNELRAKAATALKEYESADEQDISLQEVICDYANEINQIIRALMILDPACEDGRVSLTSQELEYDLVCDILRKINNTDGDPFNLHYVRLLKTESVKEVIQNTVIACKRNLSDEITNETVLSYFWQYIREGFNYPVGYNNIEYLKGSWVKALKERIEKDFK
jgi:hypothetical protein